MDVLALHIICHVLKVVYFALCVTCVSCSCTTPGKGGQSERINPVEEFGQQLEAAGFAKYGQEKMISGVTGEEMACDIYIGVVYYQRLRHMVSDKFQVRLAAPCYFPAFLWLHFSQCCCPCLCLELLCSCLSHASLLGCLVCILRRLSSFVRRPGHLV